MQVKKFEARTMQEALEMVKSQLGPDAIILSARDNNRSFGLVGEGSVEITAAVSEETLQKKKFVESRLRAQDVEAFHRSPAKAQKSMIDKMVNKYVEKHQAPKPITSRRYIDIDDDGQHEITPENVAPLVRASAPPARAPQQARPQVQPQSLNARMQQSSASAARAGNDEEVRALKGEIASLREIIAQFKEIPQNMMGSHPGADYGIPYDLSFMFERLANVGVAHEVAAEILVKAQENIPALKMKHRSLVEGWVARHILETTHVTNQQDQAKVQIFLGPAGGGKTTALVKTASHLVVHEGRKVALLTTDTFKVGATDQMRIYAQILNVPFAIVRNGGDWNSVMKYLTNIDVVLVDMPGLGLKDGDEAQAMRALMPPAILNPRVHFVASATAKDSDITETARRYSVIGFDDAIFTSLDESTQHGTIYNFIQRFGTPLHAFGIGPCVPEDFETATRERMLDLLFKITRNQGRMVEA